MKIKHFKDGDKRIIKKFAIFPYRMQDESRWLEWVYVQQKYINYAPIFCGWHDEHFTLEEYYE